MFSFRRVLGCGVGEEMSQLGEKRTLVRAYTEFPFNKKKENRLKKIITSLELEFRKKKMNKINGFTTISRKFSYQGMHAGFKRSHPPCILSLLTIPSQKPRGPASPTWSTGSQALRTHLCSGWTSRATVSPAASSHCQSTCTRMAHRG